MRYHGIIERVFLTNVAVEANDRTEAKQKIIELAEALSKDPEIYDYEEPTHVYLKEWDSEGRMLIDILNHNNNQEVHDEK